MELTIQQDYIELIKALKLANLVEHGAEAKALVDEGLIQVNGEVEHRKRRKLRPGDVVLCSVAPFNLKIRKE